MSSFTKGPWRTSGSGIDTFVRGADDTIIAVRHRESEKVHEANARLIAAAPDLLAACELALLQISGAGWDDEESSIEKTVRAAISKAKGGA